MISRMYIECDTCSQPITLRVQIGHHPHQEHSFGCPYCGEEVTFALEVKGPFDIFPEFVKNCRQGNQEGRILYLSPDFVADKNFVDKEFYFPSADLSKYIAEEVEKKQASGEAALAGPIISYNFLGGMPNIVANWEILKKAWRLMKRGQKELAKKLLDDFPLYRPDEPHTLECALFNLGILILSPKAVQWFKNAELEMRKAKQQFPSEMNKFAAYYGASLRSDHFVNFEEIIGEYFRDFNEFEQTLLYAKNEIPLPESAKATSSAFSRTKMFYGNAFETHATNISFLACINNILSGRSFDQFLKMDLKQYLTINKANRANPFASNIGLSTLTQEFDSQIRNASHHRWFRLSQNGDEISYRSGGTGALQNMTYAEYLYKCNKLFLSVMGVMCLELLFCHFNKIEIY